MTLAGKIVPVSGTAPVTVGADGAVSVAVGTAAGTVAAGDDARLGNARTPTAHAAAHATGGGDEITPAAIGALAVPGAWTAHTPTLSGSGWALGNGSMSSAYAKLGRLVVWRCRITWGSTSTYGAAQPSISAPVNAAAAGYPDASGFARYVDASASTPYGGAVAFSAAGAVQPWVFNAASTYLTVAAVTNAVPAAWAVNDFWSWSIVYEAAS